MNPLDMTGPEFLAFYVPYGLIVLAFAWVVRAMASLSTSPPEGTRWAPGSYPREGDAYAIALLRAGAPEAVRTLLSRLAGMKLIRVENRKVRTAALRNGERQLQPIELTAWQAVGSGTAVNANQAQALVDRAVRPHFDEIRQELAEQGLVPSPERRSVLRAIQIVTWLAVVGLGLAKLGVALDRGRTNVGFLIVLIIVFWITIYFVLRPPLRTSAGSRYLKWLQESHRELVQKLETDRHERPGDLALAAGIYGLGGLATIPALAALNAQLNPRNSSSSGSTGSSCSSSSSDSGSSSDGGSSCGGGGCGGCGGGGGD
jgi:uncharacterized protein (TIGR04222 family)